METNMMLDTCAGVSIIDVGTIERMGLSSEVTYTSNNIPDCIDASGNKMEIIGVIGLQTELNGTNKTIVHNFRVLNTKSCHDIICGRDFMRHYDSIEFNFKDNCIKVGKAWVSGGNFPINVDRVCRGKGHFFKHRSSVRKGVILTSVPYERVHKGYCQ